MKKILLLLFCLLSAIAQAHAKTILVVGDSLSAAYGIRTQHGWVNLLQQRLELHTENHQVVNASISGDTTQGGLTRLAPALDQFEPAILIIELGGNDGLRGVNLRETRSNLAQMIELGQQSGSKVLLLGMMLPPNFGKTFTEKFLQMYADLADEYRVQLVPFFLDGVADRQEWMQSDGIHPNEMGQPRMMENVWETLEPML
ncbi:MAG: arylesterase [Sedimenticola sp.]|jgi:acyl-CoA thioesterase-1|nr:MAG: arylesterase [Sedimenticola sp.]